MHTAPAPLGKHQFRARPRCEASYLVSYMQHKAQGATGAARWTKSSQGTAQGKKVSGISPGHSPGLETSYLYSSSMHRRARQSAIRTKSSQGTANDKDTCTPRLRVSPRNSGCKRCTNKVDTVAPSWTKRFDFVLKACKANQSWQSVWVLACNDILKHAYSLRICYWPVEGLLASSV